MTKEDQTFTTKETTELLHYIAQNMVTKQDLPVLVRPIVEDVVREVVPPIVKDIVKDELNKAKHEIMDYVDRKDREYRGELNLALQKEDYKVDAVIGDMQAGGVITAARAQNLKRLSPFKSPNY